jgi:hypothetical protein
MGDFELDFDGDIDADYDNEDEIIEDIDMGEQIIGNNARIRINSKKRKYPNRKYKLTKFELAKVLTVRANMLDKILGDIKIPNEEMEKIKEMELMYNKSNNDEQRLEIKKNIIDKLESLYSRQRLEYLKYIHLTDEERQGESDPIKLAMLEYKYKRLPMVIERHFPDGNSVEINVNELIGDEKNIFVEAMETLKPIENFIPF